MWSATATATAAFLVLAPAWADHGGATRTEGMSPGMAALLYGGLAFVLGMAVVVAVSFLVRRSSRPE